MGSPCCCLCGSCVGAPSQVGPSLPLLTGQLGYTTAPLLAQFRGPLMAKLGGPNSSHTGSSQQQEQRQG